MLGRREIRSRTAAARPIQSAEPVSAPVARASCGARRCLNERGGGVRGQHDRAVGGDDARPRRARGHRPGGRPGRVAGAGGRRVGVVEARRGGPVPPAAQPLRAVPAGLRRRATGADRPAGGGGLHLGRLPGALPPTVTDRSAAAGRRGAAVRHRAAPGVRGGRRGGGAGRAGRDRPPWRAGRRPAGRARRRSPGSRTWQGSGPTTGEELRADLVVDAMGRRTRAAEWIDGLGARPPQVRGGGQGLRLLHPLLHRPGAAPPDGSRRSCRWAASPC